MANMTTSDKGMRYFHSSVSTWSIRKRGEGPPDPHQQEYDEKRLAQEPHDAGNIVHHGIEPVEPRHMQRHPPPQEKRSGDTGRNEKVQILGQVEKAEMHTGIFRMVTGCQLLLGFGQVDGPRLASALPEIR